MLSRNRLPLLKSLRSFFWFYRVLQTVHSKVCTGGSTPAWTDIRWKCTQEESGHHMGWKVSAVLWWPEVPVHHSTYSCLCQFHKAFQAPYWCCRSGLGAVLYQTHDDSTDAIIAYGIRSLTKAESHYPTHKLEFLTLKWAVVKKFQEYL